MIKNNLVFRFHIANTNRTNFFLMITKIEN